MFNTYTTNNMLNVLQLRCEMIANETVPAKQETSISVLISRLLSNEQECPGTRKKFKEFFIGNDSHLTPNVKKNVLNCLLNSTNSEAKILWKEIQLCLKENNENFNPYGYNTFPRSKKFDI